VTVEVDFLNGRNVGLIEKYCDGFGSIYLKTPFFEPVGHDIHLTLKVVDCASVVSVGGKD